MLDDAKAKMKALAIAKSRLISSAMSTYALVLCPPMLTSVNADAALAKMKIMLQMLIGIWCDVVAPALLCDRLVFGGSPGDCVVLVRRQ